MAFNKQGNEMKWDILTSKCKELMDIKKENVTQK